MPDSENPARATPSDLEAWKACKIGIRSNPARKRDRFDREVHGRNHATKLAEFFGGQLFDARHNGLAKISRTSRIKKNPPAKNPAS